jgi:outer membrane protein, heavy metal efflux system
MKKLVLTALVVAVAYGAPSDELVSKAIQNNPEIASLQRELDASRLDKELAGKLDNPMLGVFVSNILQNQPLKRNYDPSQQINIGLTQNIPLAGRLSKKTALESAKISAMSERLSQKKLDIEFAVNEQLYNMSALEAKKKVYDKYLANYDLLLSLLNGYLASGTGSHIAIIKAEIEAQNIKNELFALDSELLSSKAKLEALSHDENSSIPTIYLDFVDVKFGRIDTSKSPLLSQKQSEIAMSEASFVIERSNYYPDIGVTVGYALADSSFRNYLFFGLNIPLPIYGKEAASSAKALVQKSQKQSELSAARNDLRYEVASLSAKYENIKKSYDLYTKLSKSVGMHGLDIIFAQIKSSRASQENAVSALNEILGFELKLIDIKKESMLIKANIKKLCGDQI